MEIKDVNYCSEIVLASVYAPIHALFCVTRKSTVALNSCLVVPNFEIALSKVLGTNS